MRLLLLLLLPACTSTPAPAPAGPPVTTERYAIHDGRGVHYLDSGGADDEALVLVHGWASSVATWRHQAPALGDRARVLAVDLPGHGRSETPASAYSMALFADAVVAVMDDAGVERAVLVGHSNGTPVVLNVLRRHPERVLALVGVDGTLKSLMAPDAGEAMFAPFRDEATWQDTMAAMIAGMAGPNLGAEDRAVVRAMALETPHEAVVGGFEAVIDPAAWSDEPLDVPLLLVLAAQPSWNADYERWVRARAPGVDWRVWEGVGHFLHMERPDDFRAALASFLDAHGLL